MKKHIAHAVNFILKPIGVKLIRLSDVSLDMPSAVKRISEHGIPIKSIIDIGASDGKWSKETIRVFPNASFVAIEPLNERQSALDTLKNKHDNFDYILCVAGGKDGEEVHLNVSENLDGSSVNGTGGIARSVPVRTVDAIVKEKSLEGPFLLKFDTHGYEIPILEGAKDTLKKTNVIIMEVYNFKTRDQSLRFYEMCSHLEQMGFCCFDIAGPMHRPYDNAFWQMDLFFAKHDSKIFGYSAYS